MENRKLAVLIDADNAQSALIAELLAEVAKYGTAVVKRAYGDWTTTQLKGWKEVLHQYAISPIQQFAYTKGKNSTDSALIIDAMDLLYTGNFDGFCLVSSDSDFTRLATRLREAGLMVIGLGEQSKTPRPFIAACDKFVFTEILRPAQPAKAKPEAPSDRPKARASRSRAKVLPQRERHPLQDMFTSAIEAVSRDSGWAELSAVGSYLAKNDPSFDPRNWGHSRLSQMVKKLDFLSVQENRNGSKLHSEIRLKHEADHAQQEIAAPAPEAAPPAEEPPPAPLRKKRSPRKKATPAG
ncbi:NYN domain-containing protein [Chromobacterium sphagni]|uniref:Maebl n=1 Tax=Chromobacterium sphagni TaxID=1903179 RepID=A0ABX3CGZ3_9NEIS|nr:NYN domain-containing protein [Chromobacterium sphagni]OHX21605.1 Maebl [Chromobacterium sphagni]